MHPTHCLLSAEAQTLSMRELFRKVRWGRDGGPCVRPCGVFAQYRFLPSRRRPIIRHRGAHVQARDLLNQGHITIPEIGRSDIAASPRAL